MKIQIHLTIAAFLNISVATAQTYDGPLSGTMVAESGGLLDYECIPSGPNQATCDFVQVLFSRSKPIPSTSKDYQEFLSDPQEVASACKFSNQYAAYIEGGVIEDDKGATPFKELGELEQRHLKEYISLSKKLCEVKSEESFRDFVEYSNANSQKHCRVVVIKYTQSYKRLNDVMWVVVSEPSGACGVINTSHFARNLEFNFLWTHSASKLVKNKIGTTDLGLGSRLINSHSQKSTVAARAMAERKTLGHLS